MGEYRKLDDVGNLCYTYRSHLAKLSKAVVYYGVVYYSVANLLRPYILTAQGTSWYSITNLHLCVCVCVCVCVT